MRYPYYLLALPSRCAAMNLVSAQRSAMASVFDNLHVLGVVA